jgi:O-antigen/teichoic acid export membrane protein
MTGEPRQAHENVEPRVSATVSATDVVAGDGSDELVEMARGGGLNLAGAVFRQLSLLGVSLILARRLGPGELGVYWQSYALLSVLDLLALGGFGAAATRFVAVHRATGDTAAVHGTIRLTLGLTVLISLALAIVLFVAAPWLADDVFDDSRLRVALGFVALTLPALAFLDVSLAATRGFKSMKAFALIGLVLEPGLRVALTVVLVVLGAGLQGAMGALAASTFAAAILAARALHRLVGRSGVRPSYRPREILEFSAMSWMGELATTGLIWADTLLLGVYLSSDQVGVYNVATRVVVFASFVMLPINAAFAPRIADLYQRGRTETLHRTYVFATTWIVRLSLPAFILLILFPRDVVAIFGSGFSAAAAVTIVLVVGKAIDAATGPCAMMLKMSGRPALNMADNVAALALNIGLNLWLIPRYGILGSAVAWAVALGVVNLARAVQVRLTMRMWPFSTEIAVALVAGAAAAVIGVAVRAVVPEPSSLIAGVFLLVATYVAVIVVWGLTAEDRTLLSSLRTTARLDLRSRRAHRLESGTRS